MLLRIVWILRTAILTNTSLLESESYMRRSEHILKIHVEVHATLLKANFGMSVQDILWMSHVHSIYVLCQRGYFTEGSFQETAVSKF